MSLKFLIAKFLIRKTECTVHNDLLLDCTTDHKDCTLEMNLKERRGLMVHLDLIRYYMILYDTSGLRVNKTTCIT